jgi:2-dehydropantoate 2-reductase
MLQDVRAGRVTEVDILQGAVAERGAALGVETPVMRTLADLIRGLAAAEPPAPLGATRAG